LRKWVNRYVYVLMSQVAQTAACVCFHVVEQRLARWLLMTEDRAHVSTFSVTHRFVGQMLGVRRERITAAAIALQSRKLIVYRRGTVTISDRKGLERASCSCYQLDLSTYESVFG
jgi:CRP-like cAMP-binding protein